MSQIEYKKPTLTIQQQFDRLQERGLAIDNKPVALKALAHINYYRLSAYCLPFKRRNVLDNAFEFQQDTTFADVLTLYEFDRKLRFLAMDALERIEISIKTSITHHLAHQYGIYVLENALNFHKGFAHDEWIKQSQKEILRSKERFIEHFREKYLGFPKLPIWMAIEVMSLGTVSKLFKGLKNNDKQAISNNYGLHYKTLVSWLHSLTYIRNVCAHHSRLWNTELAIKPVLNEFKKYAPPHFIPKNDRFFVVLLILKYLLNKTGNGHDWVTDCHQLIEPVLKKFSWAYGSMDIPKNLSEHPLWQI